MVMVIGHKDMKSYIVIIILVYTTSLVSAQIIVDSRQKLNVDSLFNNWKTTQSPGGVVAILIDEEVLLKKVYGMADVEENIPIDTNTVFNLASTVKQFVGMGIALLEEQNLLTKNDDLKTYYPNFNLPDGIKISHLLNHTSGIREAYVLLALSGKTNKNGRIKEKYNTKAYLFELLKDQDNLNFQPGDEFAYTNINYILLADIIEKVSNKSIRDFADSALFQPLKMDQSVFQNFNEKIDKEASGYTFTSPGKFEKRDVWNGVIGDLNLLSSINDLIKWEKNYFSNKIGLYPDSLIKHIIEDTYLNDGSAVRYNYGLSKINYKGIAGISHGGDNTLHTSLITRYPAFKVSIICVANSGRYYDIQEKVDRISEILLEDYITEQVRSENDLEYISVETSVLIEKTGKYGLIRPDGLAEYIEINLHDNKLYFTPIPDFKGFEMNPVSKSRFIAYNPEGERIDLTFVKNGEGELEIHQDFRDQKSVIKKIMSPEKREFVDYVGTYQSKSPKMSIRIKLNGDEIFAKKGIIKIDLIPFGKDSFFAPENDALFVFEKKGGDRIAYLIINASDFRNVKLYKK